MEPSDIEILETDIGGQVLKDMSAISFMGWLARKINGVTVDNTIRQIQTAIASPPLVSRLSDESKIDYVRLLLKAGITLP